MITVSDVSKLNLGESLWDSGKGAVVGFRVRRQKSEARVYSYKYRINGRQRLVTIGRHGSPHTPETARDEARRLAGIVAAGGDPLKDRQAKRSAPTVADLCDRFEEEHLSRKRPATKRDAESMIRRFIRPKLGQMKVNEVEFGDIDRLHRSLKLTPYQANRVLATASKMFALSLNWKWRDAVAGNPCKGVERFHEEGRERYLTTDEMARLIKALADYSEQTTADAIRLLILTGARRMEVLGATWGQFDLDAARWTKPSAHTKQKKVHHVPLSAPVTAILVAMRPDGADDSTVLFPGQRGGHLTDIKTPWKHICKAAGLESVRVHDLRHSYASMILNAGGDLALIGGLLGHTNPKTTARYSHLFDDPQRKIAETVGAIVTGGKTAEVIPFDKSQAG